MRLEASTILVAFSLFSVILPVVAVHGFTIDLNAVATIFVAPEEVTVNVNETFQVSVNVSAASKLQGFDFMLSYNTSLLDCLDLQEGTFLSASGPTFVVKRDIDDDFSCGCGRLWFVVVIYQTGYSDGNGTLAIITFRAVSAGQTVLNLYSESPNRQDTVKFTTCNSEVIPNVAIDGLVTAVTSTSSTLRSDLPPMSSSADPPSSDVNADGVLDIRDLAFVATAYRSAKGQPKYDEKADLDRNEEINIVDIVIVAKQISPK